MTNTLATYLTSQATRALWNSIPSDARVGITGSVLGGLIGPFVLPWFIPSTVPMAGGACLGVLANRSIHQVQQVGSASLCQRFRSAIAKAGSYLVRAMESLYHYFSNRRNQPFDEEGINNEPTPLLSVPPLEKNYFSNLEETLAKKNQEPATQKEVEKDRELREAANQLNVTAWMGNPQPYVDQSSQEIRYRSNEPKPERRVVEEYDEVFEKYTYTHQVRDPSSAVWTTTHVSLTKPD